LYWVIRKNVENKWFSAQSASVFCHENMHILPLSHKAPSPGISSSEWLCSLRYWRYRSFPCRETGSDPSAWSVRCRPGRSGHRSCRWWYLHCLYKWLTRQK
jgi:hypothetical protein